jgi:serine/threonine-protein kinase
VQAFEPTRFGHYVLTARLGRGGMADVFRARREGLPGFQRNVVVKRILAAHHEEPAFVQMLINEAKIAARLTHPNIVQVYELGETHGELFIAMELVEGKDLLGLLRRLAQKQPGRAALPPACSAYVAREVCRGLAHAHQHKDEKGVARPIIHRDISPQNIMLSYDGQVKLCDFGIAKALDGMKDETRTGVLKGKVAYMSPEQVSGQTPSPQSDIFALGIVLHEMLTGRRLFKGLSEYDTLQNVRSMPVRPPSARNAEVTADLDAIVLRALERDRARRYESAAEMARELDAYLTRAHGDKQALSAFIVATFDERASDKGAVVDPTAPVDQNVQNAQNEDSESSDTSLPVVIDTVLDEAAKPSPPPTRLPRLAGEWALAAALVLTLAALVYRRPAEPVDDAVAAAPAVDEVRLTSEPTGAQVYAGKKLLGRTPLNVHVGQQVTLVHAGWQSITYDTKRDDGPTVKLRMERTRRR